LYCGVCSGLPNSSSASLVLGRVGPALPLLSRLMALTVTPAQALVGDHTLNGTVCAGTANDDLVGEPLFCEPFLRFANSYGECLLPFAGRTDTEAFFSFCQATLATYAVSATKSFAPQASGSGAGAGAGAGSAEDAESLHEHVLQVLGLLTHLLTKDFIDFSGESDSDSAATGLGGQGTGAVDAVGVVFYGLSTVLPFITPDLLLLPRLCGAFFDLVGHMASDHASRFASLPPALTQALVSALNFGLKHDNSSIVRESLRGVEGMAAHRAETKVAAAAAAAAAVGRGLTVAPQPLLESGETDGVLLGWLTELLQTVIFQDGIWDRLDACADTIFALCCAQVDQLQALVGMRILGSVEGEVRRQRLGAAFQKLLTLHDLQFQLTRRERMKFRKNLRLFVSETKAFMRVK